MLEKFLKLEIIFRKIVRTILNEKSDLSDKKNIQIRKI